MSSEATTQDKVYPFIGRTLQQRLLVLLVVTVPFALTLFAITRFWGSHVTWLDLGLLFGLQLMAGIGITLGYHRMLTHGAFKARAPVKALLLWMAMNSLQGGPASWAATHRRHHSLSDRPGDPHSPLEGFWHAHFGWLWKGNLVQSGPGYEKLMEDRMVRFFERTQIFWYLMTFALPGLIAMAIAGPGAFWQAVLWGGAVRVFLVHHVTWSINSICHTFGTRPYESPDVARNNVVFGVFGFGEGWHNNHHAFPKSAYLGHRWYQVDIGRYILAVLKPLKLVTHVHVPTREERMARSRKQQRVPRANAEAA